MAALTELLQQRRPSSLWSCSVFNHSMVHHRSQRQHHRVAHWCRRGAVANNLSGARRHVQQRAAAHSTISLHTVRGSARLQDHGENKLLCQLRPQLWQRSQLQQHCRSCMLGCVLREQPLASADNSSNRDRVTRRSQATVAWAWPCPHRGRLHQCAERGHQPWRGQHNLRK